MGSVPDSGGGLELDGLSGPFHSVILWKKLWRYASVCTYLTCKPEPFVFHLLIKTGLVWKCSKEKQEPAQLILGNGFSGKAENLQHVCGNWLLWGKAG